MERRKHRRICFNAPVFIEGKENANFGEVNDISYKGAFIRTSGLFVPDENVVTSIYFVEGGSTLSVTMPGKIVRTTNDGVGFFSPHLDIYSILHFEHILAFNYGDSEKLTNDFYEYVTSKVVAER